jgi:hypothetical protein
MKNEFDSKVHKFKMELVREKLDQCTDRQIERFGSIYGELEEMPEADLAHRYFLCKRTIKSNEAKDE